MTRVIVIMTRWQSLRLIFHPPKGKYFLLIRVLYSSNLFIINLLDKSIRSKTIL